MSEVATNPASELLQGTRLLLNMYGSEVDFQPGTDYLRMLHESYRRYMTDAGYIEHEPVAITSGIDPTVRFVGSHISVLKPYLLEEEHLPGEGYSLVQNCIRTRNASTLLDDDVDPKYGSFFTSLGGIAPAGSLDKVCEDVVTFIDGLGIDPDDIRAHVSSTDVDLVQSCQNVFSPDNILYDIQQPTYYRHRFGIDGMSGRNFNLAMPSPVTNTYEDIGNIIVIDSDGKEAGVEIALGDTTTLKQLYGLAHILDVYDIQLSRERLDPTLLHKMKDAIITSVVLFQEGLRPDASNNKARILRSYCKALAYYRQRADFSLDELERVITDAELSRLPTTASGASQDILTFIESYDTQLAAGQAKSKEDEQILRNLGKHGILVV